MFEGLHASGAVSLHRGPFIEAKVAALLRRRSRVAGWRHAGPEHRNRKEGAALRARRHGVPRHQVAGLRAQQHVAAVVGRDADAHRLPRCRGPRWIGVSGLCQTRPHVPATFSPWPPHERRTSTVERLKSGAAGGD